MLPSDEWMHQSVDLVFSAPHFTERNYTGLKSRLEALYPRTDFESGVQRVSAIYTDLIFFCPSKAYVTFKVQNEYMLTSIQIRKENSGARGESAFLFVWS